MSEAYRGFEEYAGFVSTPLELKEVFVQSQKELKVAVAPNDQIGIPVPQVPEK